MEIISYFDSKSSFSIPNESPTLEELLGNRFSKKVSYKKKNSVVKNVSSIQVEPVTTPSVPKDRSSIKKAIDVFCATVLHLRYVFIAVCALLLVSFIYLNIQFHLQSFAEPVSFQQGTLFEEEILKTEMHNFACSHASSQVYEEEVLALLSDTQSTDFFSEPVVFNNYTVKSGDSIHTISNRFGLDNISTLIGLNDIENVRLLHVGQELIIPSVDGLFHTVKKGDSLNSIAKQYSISIEELLDVNELESSVLMAGEKLFIPGAILDSNTLRLSMGELYTFPLRTKYRISSYYGYRADPFTGVRSFHTGTDFAVPRGTPVYSVMSGTVSTVGYSNIYGYYVIVNHGNGYQTLYAHFMEAAPVKKGQSVTQNTVIGHVGSTGYSTGNHLHLTVYKNGKLVSPATIIKY